ncbi:hypothetical protein DS2_12749 [Catenovulum agarivorans DS-2]|uniref:DUF2878 domain-containing protein n=1 Tax=Catenovulum agarivorans DS-2 TaxID=1328313 RepID=W7Q9B3_9ALTE|nr:DUF2878 domain-containing protein [Catenovulum agarivorans]EWH09404.1 hypothetical protein DS2_12749 [Catenovulum agarivorans DS-2]
MHYLIKKFWLVNLVLFQLCWLLAAFYQQQATWVMLLVVAIHFVLSPIKKLDLKVLPLAFVGIVLDQVFTFFDVLIFANSPAVLPVWLMLLWVSFSWCLNHSLNWLIHIPIAYVMLLGAIFGPISYFGGLSLGTFETGTSQALFVTIYSLAWAVFLPLSRLYCQRVVKL